MNRRALGRGRLLIGLGSLVAAAGTFPAWWSITRTNAAAVSGNGLEGIGIVIFLAALAMLAVLVLPFATRNAATALDRPATFVLLGLIALAAFGWRVYEISIIGALGLPMQSPGMWLTGAGLLLVAWGIGELLLERPEY